MRVGVVTFPGSLDDRDAARAVRELGLPLLLAQHANCVVFTQHGFEDFVEAFPDARTVSADVSACLSGEFADALREFAESL